MEEQQPGAARGPGLLGGLRRLAGTTLALIHTRLELFVTEFEEERVWLVRLVLLSIVAAFFLSIGVITLTIFVILMAGPNATLAAGVLTALYLGIGALLVVKVRNLAHARPKLFSASLAELRRDRDELAS